MSKTFIPLNDDDDFTSEEAAAIFASMMHKASGLTFDPEAFWSPLGQSATKDTIAKLHDVQANLSAVLRHYHLGRGNRSEMA